MKGRETRPPPGPERLRAIADANRGTYFEIDQAEKLAAVIPPEEQRTPELHDLPYRRHCFNQNTFGFLGL